MARWWQSGSGHNGVCSDARTMLRLLSQPIPLELLEQLIDGEQDVTHLADRIELDLGAVSTTLKTMHGYSLVEVKIEKNWHFYRLGPGVTVQRVDGMLLVSVPIGDGSLISLTVPVGRVRHL